MTPIAAFVVRAMSHEEASLDARLAEEAGCCMRIVFRILRF
jgi:hypothetical protein